MDHKAAVAGHMLRKLTEGQNVSNKRYRATVEFTHGVRHVLDVGNDLAEDLHYWALWGHHDTFTQIIVSNESMCWFNHNGRMYLFNRDYLCSMIVEEIREEADG